MFFLNDFHSSFYGYYFAEKSHLEKDFKFQLENMRFGKFIFSNVFYITRAKDRNFRLVNKWENHSSGNHNHEVIVKVSLGFENIWYFYYSKITLRYKASKTTQVSCLFMLLYELKQLLVVLLWLLMTKSLKTPMNYSVKFLVFNFEELISLCPKSGHRNGNQLVLGADHVPY